MCGFVISIGNFSETDLKQATQSILHRGPDDTNFYFNEENKIKMPSFFGFMGWSIIFLIPILILTSLLFF